MDILTTALWALRQVVVVGLCSALARRNLRPRAALAELGADGDRPVQSAESEPGQSSGPPSTRLSPPTTLGLVGAVLCFAVVVLAVGFGIVVIIFGKQLFS